MGEKRSSLASVMLARDAASSQTGDAGDTALRERAAPAEILFEKGAATAAGFNPLHRTYDFRAGRPPADAMEQTAPPASRQTAIQPFQAAVIAFGCIALLLSAGLFLNSRSHGPGAAAPAPVLAASPPLAMAALAPALAPTPIPIPTFAPEPEAPPLEAVKAEPPATTGAAPELVARGSELLGNGDIATARLFFERGAEAGDGHAALLLGKTFDPAYLERAGVRGMRGDDAAAEAWYRRAGELGEPEAQLYLDKLAARRLLETSVPD